MILLLPLGVWEQVHQKDGTEYLQDLDKHKKDFIWADDKDGESVELAFSEKKIEARKNWVLKKKHKRIPSLSLKK